MTLTLLLTIAGCIILGLLGFAWLALFFVGGFLGRTLLPHDLHFFS